jgi:hypothetical protein
MYQPWVADDSIIAKGWIEDKPFLVTITRPDITTVLLKKKQSPLCVPQVASAEPFLF